jgi:hypothetical protein
MGYEKFDQLKEARLNALRNAVSARRWSRILPLAADYLGMVSSSERPHVFLNIVLRRLVGEVPAATQWRLFHQEWPAFDAVPHGAIGFWMECIRDAWDARLMHSINKDAYDSLDKTMTVYRGQCATAPLGLSWTLDMQVAEGFACGHRNTLNARPSLLRGEVRKRDIAGVFQDREEREVVVFDPEDVTLIGAYPCVTSHRDTRTGADEDATVATLEGRWPALV